MSKKFSPKKIMAAVQNHILIFQELFFIDKLSSVTNEKALGRWKGWKGELVKEEQ